MDQPSRSRSTVHPGRRSARRTSITLPVLELESVAELTGGQHGHGLVRRSPLQCDGQAVGIQTQVDLGAMRHDRGQHGRPHDEDRADDDHRGRRAHRRDHDDRQRRRDQPGDVVEEVVHGEHTPAVPIGQRLLRHRVDRDLLPRERQAKDSSDQQDDRPVGCERPADQHDAADEESERDHALLRQAILEEPGRGDPEKHAQPARPDHIGERGDALAQLFAEHDERKGEHDPLADLIDRDRGDRPDRVRGAHHGGGAVPRLDDDPPDRMTQELRRLRERHRREVGLDPARDEGGHEPGERRDQDHAHLADRIGDLAAQEHADEQRERPADGRDRVRDQQILGWHEAGHDGRSRRQLEPVDRQDRERPGEEQDLGRPMQRVEQDQRDERDLQQRRDRQDLAPRPSIDEHPDEGTEQGERQDCDEAGVEQAFGRVLLIRVEDDRGDQRRLEDAVAALTGQADPQQPAEITRPHRGANARAGARRGRLAHVGQLTG